MADCVNSNTLAKRGSRSYLKGLTLIEVLVALLVLSIGLVGIAALILFGLKSVHSSLQSSLASVIALDAEEWVWEALGDDRLISCDGNVGFDLETVVANLNTHWFAGAAGEGPVALTLPGGKITSGACVVSTGRYGCRIQARLDISWSEGRFADESAEEVFSYWLQAPCTEASS